MDKKDKIARLLGFEWNPRQRVFVLPSNDELPQHTLTPHELIALGVELVLMGRDALTEKRWH
jgi:hypothetical protein